MAECGQQANEITYKDFQKADIRSATVLSVEPIETNEEAFHVKLDVGEYGERLGFLSSIDRETADTLVGSQVAVLLNIEPEDIPDKQCNAILVTFFTIQCGRTIRLPLGVDGNKQVANGEKLF